MYVYDDNIIRFRYTNKTEFSEAPSYAVIRDLPAKTDFKFTDEGQYYSIKTKELTVQISKNPCRVKIYNSNMDLLSSDEEAFGVSFNEGEVTCFKNMVEGETFYGLGERTDDLNKTGRAYTLWNTDNGAYNKKTQELYQSYPFFYGIKDFKAYGIFFDNTYKSHFNFGASNNRFISFGAAGGEMDYYFIYGPEIKRVLSSYTKLTGRIELPPMWSLGYQQSRWSYFPESMVRNIAENFRDRKIPCDVIYLDIDYMDGYRVFTWDKKRFPEPAKMLSDLRANGFKIITIIDPGVKADSNYFAAKEGVSQNLFVKYPDGKLYEGEVWPSWAYFPDFTKKETRTWWGDKVSILLNDGVEGIWNDMNEPATWGQDFPDIVQFHDNGYKADHKKIHNVFALEMAKATREGLRRYSDKRHFVLSRAGFAGIQRYSAVWTGDNVSNEENLKLACVMSLNMGISGEPIIGSDVGGFVDLPDDKPVPPSPNLYIRWMELGAFTPFFRQHSAIGTKPKEPWAFGKDAENAVRDIISYRYRILPYLYNEFYVSSQTGLPIMRPMFVNYQNDRECYSTNAQYQFILGDNLLVAPVLSETDDAKRIYLPEGKWYEMNTHKIYQGMQNLLMNVPLTMTPLFLKEGGVVLMQEVQQYVGEKKIEQTEVYIYPSNGSKYSFYEDDGISFDYEKGKYSLTEFNCTQSSNSIEIAVNKSKDGYKPDRKNYLFKVVSEKKPVSVHCQQSTVNKSLQLIKSLDKLEKETSGYYYNEKENLVYIKVQDTGKFEVRVEY